MLEVLQESDVQSPQSQCTINQSRVRRLWHCVVETGKLKEHSTILWRFPRFAYRIPPTHQRSCAVSRKNLRGNLRCLSCSVTNDLHVRGMRLRDTPFPAFTQKKSMEFATLFSLL